MGEVISGSYPAPATATKGKEKPAEVEVTDE
jgi:hypothetical protein